MTKSSYINERITDGSTFEEADNYFPHSQSISSSLFRSRRKTIRKLPKASNKINTVTPFELEMNERYFLAHKEGYILYISDN
jgi:hypothetical protein